MKNRYAQPVLIIYILLCLAFPYQALAANNPVINEFLAHPTGENKEWVELYNPDKLDLASFFIDDDKSFTDDAGSSSKKSLANLLATDSAYPYIELSSLLNNSGDAVVLFDSAGNIIDETEYASDPEADFSIGRAPDGNGEFFILASSTKGAANAQSQPTPTPKPTSTPPPTPTPKSPTPTKSPTTKPANTPAPTQKLLSSIPLTKKTISPTKISSRSAFPTSVLSISTKSATPTPKKKSLPNISVNFYHSRSSHFCNLCYTSGLKNKMEETLITSSFEETQKLGFEFAKKVSSISVLALHGDLGSGKTTFIQGLAKGLGINKKILSPTFTIMRTYKMPRPANRTFYHIDLYRINTADDIKELGLLELIKDPSNLFAIEWPEKILKLLPVKRFDLSFEYIDENKRKITIT